MKYTVIIFFVLGIGVFAWESFAPTQQEMTQPPLAGAARVGQQLFQANCAACHGETAAGTGTGPPLVHDIYNPGHHSDQAFHAAVARGAQQHHWSFGNMPPQPQVSHEQTAAIIRFIRDLQIANGIGYRPHRM